MKGESQESLNGVWALNRIKQMELRRKLGILCLKWMANIARAIALCGLLFCMGTPAKAQVACTPSPGFTNCVDFVYTGADQHFTVPTGVTSINIKVWGAGAEGGAFGAVNAAGGAGGYVGGTLAVTGGSAYAIMVGNNTSGYGFGGSSGACGSPAVLPAAGLSGVFTGSSTILATDTARAILVAGGGGAGGVDYANGSVGDGSAGGQGGGTNSGGMPTMQGQTGYGCSGAAPAGGGGGGYQGGLAGQTWQVYSNWGGNNATMGDGGSNFVAALVTGSSNLFNPAENYNVGGNRPAPNNADPQYISPVGVGTVNYTAGGTGLVVIQWIQPTLKITKTTAAGSTGTNVFSFTGPTQLTNSAGVAIAFPQTISVTGVGSASTATWSALPTVAQTVTETPAAGLITTAISCNDANAAGTGNTNPVASSSTVGVNSITIPGSAMKFGLTIATTAAITCTFTNSPTPTVVKAFAPASIGAGSTSALTITLGNGNTVAATLSAALTDTLPTNLILASGTFAGTCPAASVSGSVGGSTITYASGATIPAGGCTIIATVTSTVTGSYPNTIAIGALQTNYGNNAAAATATLTVVAPVTVAKAFAANFPVGGTTTLTITLGNAPGTATTLSAPFGDTLPAGLTLLNNTFTGTCTTGSVSGAAGGSTITYASGAALPAAGCTIIANVTSSTAATYTNTIASGALKTVLSGVSTAPATANVSVTVPLKLVKAWVNSTASDTMSATTTGGTAAATVSSTAPTGATGTVVQEKLGDVITLPVEAGTNIGNYVAMVTCTNTSSPVTNATLPVSFTVGATDTAITCTYTNTRITATLQLAKVWGANSITGNQANFVATTGGANANAAFSAIAPTSSSDPAVTVWAGNSITLPGETMSPGTAADYTTMVVCTGTNQPTNASAGQTSGALVISPLDAGKAIVCTYTNTPLTTQLQIKKTWATGANIGDAVTIPATTGGSTNTAPLPSAATATTHTDTGVAVAVSRGDVIGLGAETWTTGLAANYTTTVTCNNTITPLTNATLPASFTVGPSDTSVVCTYTNTPVAPKVTLIKATTSPAGSNTFAFTNTGFTATAPSASIIVPTSPSAGVTGATVGIGIAGTQATITETAQTGWYAIPDSITCMDSNAANTGNAATNLNSTTGTAVATLPASVMRPGATITCTFSNSKPTVSLTKVTAGIQPDNALFNLGITGTNYTGTNDPAMGVGNGGTTGPVTVDTGGTVTLAETAGTYTGLSNYTTTLTCVDAGGTTVALASGGSTTTGTIAGTTVGIAATTPIGNARKISCTLTNTSTLPSLPTTPTLSCAPGASSFDTGRFPFGATGKDSYWQFAIQDGGAQGVVTPPATGWYPATLAGSGAWAGVGISASAGTQWICGVPGCASSSGQNDSWYKLNFNLDPTVNPATVSLTMNFSGDNDVVAVWVNGVLQTTPNLPTSGCGYSYAPCNGFKVQSSVTLSSNWQAGANTLVVQIGDGGGISGFLANFSTAALCRPELTVNKQTQGGSGGVFNFTGTNGWVTPGTGLTTTAIGAPGQVSTSKQILAAASTATALTETMSGTAATAGYVLSGATCTGTSGNVQPTVAGNVVTIPANALDTTQAAAGLQNVSCTVTNAQAPTVTLVKKITAATNAANTFSFTNSGFVTAPSTSVTVASNPTGPVGSTSATGAIVGVGAVGTQAVITETALGNWFAIPDSVSCLDSNAAASGNVTTELNSTPGTANATLPASVMKAGAVITCTFSNSKPTVTVIKNIVGTPTDGGLFNLSLTPGGSTFVGGTNPASNVGNLGTTGPITVDAGQNMWVLETAGTGTSLGNYTANLVCKDGTGTVLSFGGVNSQNQKWIYAPAASTAVGAARNVTCTFTNTVSSISVTKVFSGGAVDAQKVRTGFVNSAGNWATNSAGTTANSGGYTQGNGSTFTFAGPPADTYTIQEDFDNSGTLWANYTPSVTCKDGLGNVLLAPAAMTIANGASNRSASFVVPATFTSAAQAAMTCTITNTANASITFNKTKAGSGNTTATTASFSTPVNLKGTPATITSGTADGVAGVNNVAVEVTANNTQAQITEVPSTGFNITGLVCTDTNAAISGNATGTLAATFTAAGVITFPFTITKPGANIVCAITNTSNATISFNKIKAGTGNGTATTASFSTPVNLNSTPAAITSGATDGVAGTTGAAVVATANNTAVQITEVPAAGFAMAGLSCTDNNAAASGNPAGTGAIPAIYTGAGVITIPAGNVKDAANIVCSITNVVPTISVTKAFSGTAIDAQTLAQLGFVNNGGWATGMPATGVVNGGTVTLTSPPAGTAWTIQEGYDNVNTYWSNYTTTATCQDGLGNTMLSSGTALSIADGTNNRTGNFTIPASFTSPAQAKMTCTITNTVVAAITTPPTVDCTTNPAIFNTAVNTTYNGVLGVTSSPQTYDAHWEHGIGTATTPPTSWARAVVSNVNGGWTAAGSNYSWISDNWNGANGAYVGQEWYRYTFNLAAGVDPTTFAMTVSYAADDSVTGVYVNGVQQANAPAAPYNAAPQSITLTGNWHAGSNVIMFDTPNLGGAGGFMASNTAVCHPKVTFTKQTQGGFGGPFNFSGTNGWVTPGTGLTTTGVGAAGQASTAPQILTAQNTATTFTETMPANYGLTSATCTGTSGNVQPTVNAAAGTITLPANALITTGTAAGLPTVACTVVNTIPAANITLTKALGGNRLANTDQFQVQILTGSASGTVVSSSTNATTTGTGSTVTAGTGTTGVFAGIAGTNYWLTEVAQGTANLANYTSTIACTDANGKQTGLPAAGTAFNPATGLEIPAAVTGANITCTITNTPNAATLTLAKDWGSASKVGDVATIGATSNSATPVVANTVSFNATAPGSNASAAISAPVGTVFTLPAETMTPFADLANYVTTITCTGGTLSGTNGQLATNTLTINPADSGKAITCTYTNAAAGQADLSITKNDGTALVAPGATNTYTIVVSNAGPATATNAVFTDPAVTNLSVSAVTCGSASGGAACPTAANTTVALMQGAGIVIPGLPAGGSVTFTVTSTVTGAAGTTIDNIATIAPPAGLVDPVLSNNSATDTDTVFTITPTPTGVCNTNPVLPDFTSGNWTKTGTWNTTATSIQGYIDGANASATQTVSGGVTGGALVSFNWFYGKGGGTVAGNASTIQLIYGGVVYWQAQSTSGSNTSQVPTALNGATCLTGCSAGVVAGSGNQPVLIRLPAGVPGSGTLNIFFQSGGGVADDIGLTIPSISSTGICLVKNSIGGAGTFNFATSGLDTTFGGGGTTASITTTTSNTPKYYDASATGTNNQALLVKNPGVQAVSITETPAAGFALNGVACTATNQQTGATTTLTPTVSGNTASFASVPQDTLGICTFTNQTGTLTLNKALGGARFASTDQFTMAIKTGGTVVNATAASTTTGATNVVTSGTGTTGAFQTVAGTAYTLTEAASGTTVLANYAATIGCTDSAGLQTGLPVVGTAFAPATGLTITPVAGANITCTITNSPAATLAFNKIKTKSLNATATTATFSTPVNLVASAPTTLGTITSPTADGATTGTNSPAVMVTANNTQTQIIEVPAAGYVISALSCTDSNAAASGNPVGAGAIPATFSAAGVITVPAANVRPGASIVCAITNAKQPTVLVTKTSVGNTGAFKFNSLVASNGYASRTVTTAVSGTKVTDPLGVQALTAQGVATNIVEDAFPGTTTAASYAINWSCSDANYAADGNTAGSNPLTGMGATAALPTGAAVSGAAYTCDFTNNKVPTISLQKALGGTGRINAADQFQISATGDAAAIAASALASATSTGAGATVTGGTGLLSFAGAAGTTYTLNEAMAAGSTSTLAQYSAVVACTNPGGTTNVTGFTTLPITVTPVLGDAITCTVTNSPAAPTIKLIKALGGTGRINATDQFLLTGTGTGAPAATTTTGTGAAVTSPAYSFTATAGVTYTLNEAMAAGSTSALTQYAQTVSCTNAGPTSVTGLTALPISVKPALGDAITCTITNAPAPPTIKLQKALGSGGRINALDQFALSATGTGAPAATATTGSGAVITSPVYSFTATAGSAYVLNEAMAVGSASKLAQYTQGVACTNAGPTSVTGLTALPINVTPALGDLISCTVTNTIKPATVAIIKTSVGGVGTFNFAATNLVSNPAPITTLVVGTPVSGAAVNVTTLSLPVTITETPQSGYALTAVSCTDANAAATGNPASFGSISATNVATIPQGNVVAGAAITCSLTNSAASTLTVYKFWDTTAPGITVTIPATTGLATNTTQSSLTSQTFVTFIGGAAVPIYAGQTATLGAETGTIAPYATDLQCFSAQLGVPGDWATAPKVGTLSGTNGQASNTLALSATATPPANVYCYYRNRNVILQVNEVWAAGSRAGDIAHIAATTGGVLANTTPFNVTATAAGSNGTSDAFGVPASVSGTVTLPAETLTSGSLANYTTTLSCKTWGGATPASTLSGTNGQVANTLTINLADATDAGANGVNGIIACTYTNTPRTATLQLAKTWGGAGTLTTDSARIGATTGGANNTSSFTIPGGTPANSGAAVTVVSGDVITLPAETGTNIANYSTTVACANSTNQSTNAANGQASGTLTIAPGDNGAAIVCTYTNTRKSATLTLKKVWSGGPGGDTATVATTGFTNAATTGASVNSGNNTTTGTPVTVYAGEVGTIAESFSFGSAANYTATLACTGTTGLVGTTLTVGATDGAIVCTETNTYRAYTVSGRVFADNGAGGGTANNGVIDGSEPGIANVSVSLTNCAGTSYGTTTTGGGNYSIAIPLNVTSGSALCIAETNATTYLSTGASVGSTALPSGTGVAAGGTTYTYNRATTPDVVSFTWGGSDVPNVNFGDVAPNTFAVGQGKSGIPGNTVTYPHTFTALSGGSVSFGVPSSVSAPTLSGWSETVFADPGCTGALQSGAATLYPPSVATTLTQGQQMCIIVREFIPATAQNGYTNTANVQANFTYTNASPGLSATYSLSDITTVSSSALNLAKAVRNVTQGGTFGVNNTAKSGEVLEYRITYTNNGTTPINNLSINDVTPNYTTFVSAAADVTPATLTACSKTTPAGGPIACATAQVSNGIGTLSFIFTGSLQPGATGDVLFQVKVN